MLRVGFNAIKSCLRGQTTQAVSHQTIVEKYSGPKRKAYEKALQELNKVGLLKKDYLLKSFVKVGKTTSPEQDDPRIIQARSMKFNLEIARYHHQVEEKIYHLVSKRKYGGSTPSRMSAKGHNLYERAAEIKKRWNRFGEDVACAMLDCSRFDGHVRLPHQQGAHGVYRSLNPSRKYQRLLARTLKSRGSTSGGIRYYLGDRRASGDVDTACGNTVIMLAMLLGGLSKLGVRDFDIYGDGDDVLIFTKRKWMEQVNKLPAMFHEMGHKLRYVNWATQLGDIVFCRSRVVETINGAKLCRDPMLVLETALSSHKYFGTKFGQEMLKAYASGYESVHRGEPILGPFFSALARKVGLRPDLVAYDKDLSWTVKVGGRGKLTEVTDDVRQSYYLAWGIHPAEQLSLEARLSDKLAGYQFEFPVVASQ